MDQLLEIARVVVGSVVLPAFPQNADPFESQGAENGGVVFALLEHARVINSGPRAIADGLAGPFHKGLSEKSGSLPAPMRPDLAAALFAHGRHANVFLQAGWVWVEGSD